MRTFAAIIILLGASCMLCAADWVPNISWPKQINGSFKALNDYLADQVESSDLAANVEAAKKYVAILEQEQKTDARAKGTLELAKLVAKLDADNVCEAENMANKRTVIKALLRYEPRLFEGKIAMMRLGTLMYDCLVRARQVCFAEYEQQWLANGRAIDTDFNKSHKFPALADYDHMNRVEEEPKPKATRDDVRQLQVAVDRFYTQEHVRSLPARSAEPTAEEFAEVEKDYKPFFEISKKFGMTKPEETPATMQKRVQDEYYEPCKKLVDRDESRSILEPLGQLASLVDLTKLAVKPVENDEMSTFVWAARYYACKWQLNLDPGMVAGKISEIIDRL